MGGVRGRFENQLIGTVLDEAALEMSILHEMF